MASSQGPNNAITARNREHSPLLRLPTELRNKIYRYAIGDDRIMIWPSLSGRVNTQWQIGCGTAPTRLLSALGSTCSQLHSETGL
ncbi:hypothetical protein G6514_001794 [Epicoccum nigrum]|nr:hypothetical protein G6514_001794 [Epicoccum nigrum]